MNKLKVFTLLCFILYSSFSHHHSFANSAPHSSKILKTHKLLTLIYLGTFLGLPSSSAYQKEINNTIDNFSSVDYQIFDTQETAQENLVLNGDFNDYVSHWNLEYDFIKSENGNKYIEIHSSTTSVTQHLNVKSHTNYNLTAELNYSSQTNGKMKLQIDDIKDISSGFELASDSFGWKKFSTTFNSKDHENITLRMSTSDDFSGKVYFDNISITEIAPPITSPILLPIEVLGQSGTKKTIHFSLDDVSKITHIYLECYNCGYIQKDHNLSPDMTKASLRVNNQTAIPLQYFKSENEFTGNPNIKILGSAEAYGGIGGPVKTIRFMLPINGLINGENSLTFEHVDLLPPSIGFRILDLNLLEDSQLEKRVLPDSYFSEDLPENWKPPRNSSDEIAEGERLWHARNILRDPLIEEFYLQRNNRVIRNIAASCSDCHTKDGEDLKYFNYSNKAIIERSLFHGLTQEQGEQIASYIRSIDIPIVKQARPWNPPFQPGPGLDNKPSYEWGAGAGIKAILENDSDMEPYLFPSNKKVSAVVDRFSTLNMRELPIDIQLPDWNEWLPRIHPIDAFDVNSEVINSNDRGDYLGMPYFDYLYNKASDNPTPRNLGDFVERLGNWFDQDANCYTQSISNGPDWRSLNGRPPQDIVLSEYPIPMNIDNDRCDRLRNNLQRSYPIELAKNGLMSWTSVKLWEIIHSNNLDTMSQELSRPVCTADGCVDASEARGWFTTDRFSLGMNVFTRAAHYIGYNSKNFIDQDLISGRYQSSAWYHLQMIINPGYRRTAPSHFVYTLGHIIEMVKLSKVQQSFRFWASLIKMRQQQTSGRYGVENGLDLRTAQAFQYYSTRRADTSIHSGVGKERWIKLMEAMIIDFVEDAKNASPEDWSSATNNRRVQSRNSRDFSMCDSCFEENSVTFSDGPNQGKNTARVIPKFIELGIDKEVINKLIDWCESMWIYGPWDELRP